MVLGQYLPAEAHCVVPAEMFVKLFLSLLAPSIAQIGNPSLATSSNTQLVKKAFITLITVARARIWIFWSDFCIDLLCINRRLRSHTAADLLQSYTRKAYSNQGC
eukprot:TRINITY_DN15411_c2_g1_i1.p1 TRINITY_DN15411_c2_g1~~TRINITY_DN15411_c2_g1_i1.p1  ORF type:complete len:105 (+),score=11.89 TRINITY_DN15411_c2_g1_i1:205-519(+)